MLLGREIVLLLSDPCLVPFHGGKNRTPRSWHLSLAYTVPKSEYSVDYHFQIGSSSLLTTATPGGLTGAGRVSLWMTLNVFSST